jgi:ribosomal protein S12 methylthiotransferase accessory factor
VVGVGRIFEMYSTGMIDCDDEVALLFHPDTYRPLTVPLINVRYAVERLVRSATLSRSAGDAIIEACKQLHYTKRTYPTIFSNSKLAQNLDVDDIIRLLRNFDLKRDDAQFLLETIAQVIPPAAVAARSPVAEPAEGIVAPEQRAHDRESAEARVLVWESGDVVDFPELVRFLKVTGAFEQFARNALGRMAIAGTPLRKSPAAAVHSNGDDGASPVQSLLDATRLQWGWESPEEAHITMRDLGLGLLDVASSLQAEVKVRRLVATFGLFATEAFQKAVRTELWMNELALKREALRLGALQYLAAKGSESGPPTESDLSDARRCICRLRGAMRWSLARSELSSLGMTEPELDAMVDDLALARRAARPIVEALDHHRTTPPPATPRAACWRALGLEFMSSPKSEGSTRFSCGIDEAVARTEQIARQMGIVRIGLIGELDTLGIHVAQAFGDRSGWSSTFSSGKAETREGARVGSIMEETEIHAQDAFQPAVQIRTSFVESQAAFPLVVPRELDLPYDSRYSEALEIEWSECIDLLANRKVLIPSACLIGERVLNDIYYSPRLGGKIFSSSGLGSGFSLAEAAVHAAAEYIERHAVRLAEIEIDNPGAVGVRQFWFVDHRSLPETPQRIVEKYRKAGMCVRILDITSEIRVPTFYARVFDDPFEADSSMSSDGFACHPDPEVAVTMALLEAAQTKAGVIAGGREDYSLQARSLGRHERPRTMASRSQVFWFCNDRPVRSFQETIGLVTRDILEELEWIVDRVQEAGFRQFLVVDYTMERIRPAHTVRVILPGLESTNPLYTGARARATTIRDLLPSRAAQTE